MNNDEDKEFLISLRDDFLIETKESLEKCEKLLLDLEINYSEEHFKEYLRVLHSMKGSARAVELAIYSSLFHYLESQALKKDPAYIDTTLKIIDSLNLILQKSTGSNIEDSNSEIEQYLKA